MGVAFRRVRGWRKSDETHTDCIQLLYDVKEEEQDTYVRNMQLLHSLPLLLPSSSLLLIHSLLKDRKTLQVTALSGCRWSENSVERNKTKHPFSRLDTFLLAFSRVTQGGK